MAFLKKQLIKCARHGSLERLTELLQERDGDVNTTDDSGASLLHIALRYSHMEIARYLCESGANLEARDTNGRHPIHEVASYSVEGGVGLLSQFGAEIDAIKHADWTPLMLACTSTALWLVKEFVCAGANVQLINKDGWTPLHLASRVGDASIVEYLLCQYPEANAANRGEIYDQPGLPRWMHFTHNGRTPLHVAATHGHVAVIDTLMETVQQGSRIHIAESRTHTFTCTASSASTNQHVCAHKYTPTTASFPTNGQKNISVAAPTPTSTSMNIHNKQLACMVNVRDSSDSTPLMCAVLSRNAKAVVCVMAKWGADVSARDKNGRQALHVACLINECEIAKILLNGGADINAVDGKGTTSLHCAARGGHVECLKLLAGCTASNTSARDNYNRTAYDLARGYGHTAACDFLSNMRNCVS
eukprot:CFRG4446T1